MSHMAGNRIRVALYSGGTIIEGAQGCGYSLPPQRMMIVVKSISLRVFLSLIHSKLNIDRSIYKIRLICRYPWIYNDSGTTFLQVPIHDDEALSDVLDIPSNFPFCGVEIFAQCSAISLRPSSAQLVGGQHGREGMERLSRYKGERRNDSRQPSLPGSSRGMRKRGLNNDIGEYRDDNLDLFSTGVKEEGEKIVDDEADEISKSDSVLENDQNEKDDIDNAIRMGDPDDEVPFYSSLGDEKYHRCDSYDNFNDHVDLPVWIDEKSGLKKGMVFGSKELLQYAVKRVCAREMKEYKVCISNPTAWKVQCKNLASQSCSWMVSGTKKRHTCFQISKVNGEHSCTTTVSSDDHPNIDSKSIARMIRSNVAENPAYKPRDVRVDMRSIGIEVTYKKAWLGKKRAKEDLYGN